MLQRVVANAAEPFCPVAAGSTPVNDVTRSSADTLRSSKKSRPKQACILMEHKGILFTKGETHFAFRTNLSRGRPFCGCTQRAKTCRSTWQAGLRGESVWEKILNRGWGGILPNGVHNLLPQGNRKRALQVFDQIVHVFYSDRNADKVSW